MDIGAFPPEVRVLFERYRKTLPQRMEMGAILRALGGNVKSDAVLLDIGMPSPVLSFLLRQRGGAWTSLFPDEESAREAALLLEKNTGVFSGATPFPLEESSFDWVVVSSGVLAEVQHEDFFIQECHRVLKPAGGLIVCVPHQKPLSIVPYLRRTWVSGPSGGEPARHHAGYTERDVFLLLKTGFDVLDVQTYGRLLVELVRIWSLVRIRSSGDPLRVERKTAWLYPLVNAFDYLGRGHTLVVHCRRRQWRPRTLPTLSDGRTIHEAVLRRTGR